MKGLSFRTKKGRIHRNNIDPLAVAISVGVGVTVAIGTGLTLYNQAQKYEYSSEYDSYTDQLESLFDVDISAEDDLILDRFQGIKEEMERYENTDSPVEKGKLYESLVDKKEYLETAALIILKTDIAKQYGGHYDEYKIQQLDYEPVWVAYNNVDSFELKDEREDLVNAIGETQTIGSNDFLKQGDYSKVLFDRYDRLIETTAKFITKTSEKTK